MNIKNNTETSLHYFDDCGNKIFKAEFHLNRGDCCFSYCLHCPYGTTAEKFKISAHAESAAKIILKLKGFPCAEQDTLTKKVTIYPHFILQDLEVEISKALDIFYKDKDAQ